ncbi:MAG: DUF1801 domain-containing protein [Bacteroidota bacterium]
MAQNKTQPTAQSVTAFLNTIKDDTKRNDSFTLLHIMKEITGEDPILWGNSLIGFGKTHYKYKSGREGDWFLVGFAPRVQYLTLYIMPGFERYETLMKQLGKHKTGKSCLYIKKLEDVDMKILKELITQSAAHTKASYNH